MRYKLIEQVQSDNCNKTDDYTTMYDQSNTYKVIDDSGNSDKTFIIRIDYYQNNNVSSSPNDKSMYLLGKSGWILLGNSYNISQKYPTTEQYDCRIGGIKENQKLWIKACKKYFNEIHVVL